MPDRLKIDQLKRVLRREVSLFCRHDSQVWKRGITETVDQIQRKGWQAVFFGGTLRSLLLSRLSQNLPGRPRDIDIVVKGTLLIELKDHFAKSITRQTRFGGLQLKNISWQFDLWPLEETHAFKAQGKIDPDFADLPSTTFFNLEAVAIDVWPRPGLPRRIYSGNDQFFDGVIRRLLDINNEENPYPELCVVRTLILANQLRWRISNRLGRYVNQYGAALSTIELESIQMKHYGTVHIPGSEMCKWIDHISKEVNSNNDRSVELPWIHQMELWPDDSEITWPRISLSALGPKDSAKKNS